MIGQVQIEEEGCSEASLSIIREKPKHVHSQLNLFISTFGERDSLLKKKNERASERRTIRSFLPPQKTTNPFMKEANFCLPPPPPFFCHTCMDGASPLWNTCWMAGETRWEDMMTRRGRGGGRGGGCELRPPQKWPCILPPFHFFRSTHAQACSKLSLRQFLGTDAACHQTLFFHS